MARDELLGRLERLERAVEAVACGAREPRPGARQAIGRPGAQRPASLGLLVSFGVPLEGFASEAGFGGGPRRDRKSRSPAPRAEVPRGPSAAWSLGFWVANPGC